MSCTEEHEQILERLDELQKSLEFHIAEGHANLMEAREIIERDKEIAAEFAGFTEKLNEVTEHMDDLADLLLGNKKITYDGVTVREEGLLHTVDDLKDGQKQVLAKLDDICMKENKVKLSRPQFWTFLGTVVTTLGVVLVALLQTH